MSGVREVMRNGAVRSDAKAQWVRVLDVFVIGPMMIAAGFDIRGHRRFLGYGLIAFGVSTILYNARNWFAVRARSLGP